MSERKAKAARRSAKDATDPSANGGSAPIIMEPSAEPPDSNGPHHPGVLVQRVPTGDGPGREQVQIVPINGMDTLAVPTLLKLAIRDIERSFGLGERG